MTRTVTRIVLPLTLLTAALALALPAQASLTRTFVSAAGSDSNPCTITQPCATFAHAYSLTAANGIVAALDPGKYGPLTITGPITINGNGWAAITAPAAGNGITITAGGSDNVALIGLAIDGAGAGYNGVVLNSAGSLTVTNCTLQNFAWDGSDPAKGNGILMQPTTPTLAFTITNTTASNNAVTGINYFLPPGSTNANGVIDHVVADANQINGIVVEPGAGGSVVVTISDSIASNNGQDGIFAGAGSTSLKVSIDNVTISGNNIDGIRANPPANVLLGRSVITGNTNGVTNNTSGTFYTYKDNRINLNGTDIGGFTPSLNTTFTVQ
jgi:hypothetical protein